MRPTRFLFLYLLLCALAVILASEAYAAPEGPFTPNYAHAPAMVHLLHWPSFPIRVFVATHNPAEEQAAKTTLAGFDQWVHATKSIVRYVVVASPAQADLTVRFNAAPFLRGRAGLMGQTDVVYSDTTLKSARMELAIGQDSPDELQSSAAHEFGHALGIDGHSDNADDLMYPVQTYMISDLAPFPALPHPVTTRDLNTLKICYPSLFAPF